MIYLFCGDDSKNKILSYEKLAKIFLNGKETFLISRNNFDRMQVESLYSGAGLFSAKLAVVFSNVLDYEETRDFVLEKLDLIGRSQNEFIFLEGKLSKPILEDFKKIGAEVKIFELPKEKKEKFDNFLVAGAFEKKDKLNMWIYFRQAMERGVVMEEITGVLFWKIKDMILKKNFAKFSEQELQDSAIRLSYLLPEARRSGLDAESAFEQFLLEAF